MGVLRSLGRSVAKGLSRPLLGALRACGIRTARLRRPDLRTNGLRLTWGAEPPGLTRGTVFEHEIEGRRVLFFVTDEDDMLQHDHVAGRWYEREELGFIADHYRGGAFVDVGAGLGNHSLFAGLAVGVERIIAFEPNPPAFAICRVNLLLNGLAARTTLHAVGLSDRATPGAVARVRARNIGATAIAPDPAGPLALRRGDEMIGEETAGFVKIDVEGHELAVLAGLAGTLARDRPPILVEVDHANRDAFLAWVESHGYRVAARHDRSENSNFMLLPVTGEEERG